MDKLRIGIICPSEIAFRRFLPAIKKCEQAEYVGVAHAAAAEWAAASPNEAVLAKEREKAAVFQKEHGGKVFAAYADLLSSADVDAVYLPLPPALHYEWAQKALEHGKHVFVEKPSTCSLRDTANLVSLAAAKGLALHENYMFVYHLQLQQISRLLAEGAVGKVRLYRIAFGFPKRGANDFRYLKALGGGALLDCGGYTLRLATLLLGDTAKVLHSRLNYEEGCEVDLYGSATLENSAGVTAQTAFGMDNGYKCQLEVWGSEGCLRTERILTAPDGFVPTAEVKIGNKTEIMRLPPDDTFRKSIERFCQCVSDEKARNEDYQQMLKQAELVEQVKGE